MKNCYSPHIIEIRTDVGIEDDFDWGGSFRFVRGVVQDRNIQIQSSKSKATEFFMYFSLMS